MTPQRQPTNNTCGQTCLSMITGIPVDQIIQEIGKKKTTPNNLRKWLKDNKYEMSKLICTLPCRPEKCGTYLLLSHWIDNYKCFGHWFVYIVESEPSLSVEIYDPAWGNKGNFFGFGGNQTGKFYLVKPI